jgi:predicted DNA-binding ribbon-helix-helix protein
MMEPLKLRAPAKRNDRKLRPAMDSVVLKRSVTVADHKTSVSLEDAFWSALKAIAVLRETNLSDLITSIGTEHRLGGLSSSIRIFVLDFYRSQLNERVIQRPQRLQASNSTLSSQD